MDIVEAQRHSDIEPLAFLLGTWRGEGRGEYATIEPFTYAEEITFEHVGEPWLAYSQKSWSPDDGAPHHLERGFLRVAEAGGVELILAHPIGVAEVAHGQLDGTSLELVAGGENVVRTVTGLDVIGLVRRYKVDGDLLAYELDMATSSTPMSRHLSAELRRVM